MLVAPYVGAWIEISAACAFEKGSIVAPYVGAWIEIELGQHNRIYQWVAPLAGAWIEIILREYICPLPESHPSRVCGLKLFRRKVLIMLSIVAPLAGAWIEIQKGIGAGGNFVAPYAGAWVEIPSSPACAF